MACFVEVRVYRIGINCTQTCKYEMITRDKNTISEWIVIP